MRRILAVAAAVLILALPSAPVQADSHYRWPKTNCKSVGESAELCLDVYVDKLSGGGLGLEHVYVRIKGGFWESNAFDCDWLTARNDNDNIVWRKDNNACDVVKWPPYTLFHPHQDMPHSRSVLVTVAGWPHLDKEKDPGYTKVSVSVSY